MLLFPRPLGAALLVLFAPLASAQERPIAWLGAHLIPVSTPEIPDGAIVFHRGRIAALGARGAVAIPADAEVRELGGRVVMPGLVCTHSHIGGAAGADESSPIQPDVRVADAIDVRSSGFPKARAGGLTLVNVMPGSGHLLSGQTIYLKLRRGRTLEELLVRDENGRAMGGIKMANGTNSRGAPPFPGTRAKSAALVREEFVRAQEYRAKLDAAAAGNGEAPARDLRLEALVEVLRGQRVVHHHTHRHDDILTVLRLAQEFGFRVVLHHVSDGALAAREIAAAKAPCSLIVIDSPGGKQEALGMRLDTGAVLEQHGVLVAFHTDDGITDSRWFLRSAALGARGGMTRAGALKSATLAGAEMLDLGARTGSLEIGKDADFCVLSGDPLSVYSRVLETWVEGQKVFDLADPEDRLYAVGGPGASQGETYVSCCEGVSR
ncbi:MAG: amidohydrolase family protein [Planctomycetes bacterium]|nr:amidohydrolase family protein [Planctomycetota bacterium]